MFQPCECPAQTGSWTEYSSWLVTADGVCELGGVSVPVAAGVVDPVNGGGGVDSQQVGEDGGWSLGGDVSEGGPAAG